MNQDRAPTVESALTPEVRAGEMAARIKAFDWSKTPLGPAGSWSPALRTTLRIMLANRFPHILWWGPKYVQFYNDAYRPIPGAKHPDRVLGRPASECWDEIWHIIGPLIDRPFQGGPATWNDDIFLEIKRHGFLEESHFTIAYSPVPDETVPSGIGGVLATVHEITDKVVGERRVVALRDLGARIGEAKGSEEACAIAAQALARHDKDIPFMLLYLIDGAGQSARLAGATGVSQDQDISPLEVDLTQDQQSGWPFARAMRSEAMQVIEQLADRFGNVPHGPWTDPPHSAVVMSIPSNKTHESAALMVAGVSARLRWDRHYQDFFELLRTQIATTIANARAYEEERKRAQALAELDRAKTAFFSNISHEFRTPLTLMLAPVEDLLAKSHTDLPPAAASSLEIASRNGKRLLRLVNTLLDFSRIEAGRVRAVYEACDLAGYTAELASAFRAAVEQGGLELIVEGSPLPEPVFVDRDMWEKIVLNLLSNAFKFTCEGQIAVSVKQVGQCAELRVRDTGTGIPAEELPRLFERFHRVQNARGRTYEGSGIGLALVQELVKLHGGSVAVESAPQQGTTFTVSIPLGSAHLPPDQVGNNSDLTRTAIGAGPFVEEALRWLPNGKRVDDVHSERPAAGEMAASAAFRPHKERANQHRPRVLVVDDNADMRQYIVRLLDEQYRTDVAADGRAALAAVRAQLPDLILSDIMMPGLDGFGLLRELRADPHTRNLPIILLSARAGEESRVEGMQAGPDDYLTKPFSGKELVARVSAHLQMAVLRREAAKALQESHDRFEALFNAAPLGMFLVDTDLRIRQVNPKARPFFDRITDLIGSDFAQVIHLLWPRAYADDIVEHFRHTLTTGEPYFVPERMDERRDRSVEEYYEWQINRIRLPDGRHGVVCYFSDISRHVLARQALAATQEALKDSDRRKDEFLATLAHELRNPLAPLRNGLQIMRLAGRGGNSVDEAREMMERQLSHMIRLIDDLLDLNRISQGKIELRKERAQLAAIVQEAVETSRPALEQARHKLSMRISPDPIYVDADATRMAQVFSNLLNNAAKFTRPAGNIGVAVEYDNGQAVVSVRDDGVGIPSHMLSKVFDLFTQVDRSLERSQGGLGIGLTIVKRLVEMHGGTIEAKSHGQGMGSEFIVRLPLALSLVTCDEHNVDADNDRSNRLPRRRILIVDDNRDSATSLAQVLKIMGNDARTAHDGLEAVELATAFRPDVVLLDIGMPRLNGYDACRRIREQPWGHSTLLVAMTGWGQEEDRRRSREAGFDFHLVKPVDAVAIERLLQESAETSTDVTA